TKTFPPKRSKSGILLSLPRNEGVKRCGNAYKNTVSWGVRGRFQETGTTTETLFRETSNGESTTSLRLRPSHVNANASRSIWRLVTLKTLPTTQFSGRSSASNTDHGTCSGSSVHWACTLAGELQPEARE